MTQGPGFLTGMLRGAVLSLAVLAALSAIVPGPEHHEAPPPQDRLEPPPGSEFSRAPAESPARLPETQRQPEPGPAAAPPAGVAPAVPEAGAGAETAPVARPEVADAPAAPPAAPEAESAPPPPASDAAAPGVDVPRSVRLPQIVPAPATSGAPVPEPDSAPATSRLPQVVAPPAAGAAAQETAPAPAGPQASPAPTPPEPVPAAESAAAPISTSRLPQITQPAGPRLPGVAPEGAAPALPGGGAALAPAPAAGAEPATDATAEVVEAPRLGALVRNALPFEAGERPLMAVVLIDAGEAGADLALLGSIPFPVSFAVDPSAPDAADRAQVLRAAGFEVLVRLPEGAAGLPEGAAPADVETALAAHEGALPMAVAVLAPNSDAPLAVPGPLARQMLAHLARSGHGLVLAQAGLNSLSQAAARAGVPALTLFRSLDAAGEAAPAIRRYLDRAAFEARAQGQVAMLGSTYPETVRALLEWGAGPEARSVALAPVSALLRAAR